VTDLSSVLSQNIASLMPPQDGASGDIVWLNATIIVLPSKIEILTRQIQITGSLISLSDTGDVTFQTAAGTLSLSLSSFLEDKGNTLAPLLSSLLQNQKPLDLVLKPGTPPLAFLGIPASFMKNVEVAEKSPSLSPLVPNIKSENIVLNRDNTKPLNAIVLPSDLRQNLKAPEVPLLNATKVLPSFEKIHSSGLGKITSSFSAFKTFLGQESQPAQPKTDALPQKFMANPNEPVLTVGSEVKIKILSPTAAATTNQINATLLSHGPEGQSILDTGSNLLYIRDTLRLPIGSQVRLQIETLQPKLVSTPPDDTQNLGFIIQKIAETIRSSDPSLAHQLLHLRTPQPTTALPGALLFLLGALQQGELRQWIGPDATANLLQAGKKDFLEKMEAAFKESEVPVQDTTVGTWRSWMIPFGDPAQLQKMQMAIHQETQNFSDTQGGRTTEKQTRFLINVQFSNIGALQMDGLARPKKLDLVLRSEAPLPLGLAHELRSLYVSTLETVNLTGTIGFQAGKEQWVTLRKPTDGTSEMV